MDQAAQQYRRVKGYRQLAQLAAVLKAVTAEHDETAVTSEAVPA